MTEHAETTEVTQYTSWALVPFGGELLARRTVPDLAVRMDKQSLVVPYNYIPFFKAPVDGDLGEGDSPGHAEWLPGHYSGELRLTWRAVRPLLTGHLTDVTKVEGGAIGVHSVPVTEQGHPELPGTATKGPLRNLFGAITGSRLDAEPGVEPLIRRRRPDEALALLLGKVHLHEPGQRLVLWVNNVRRLGGAPNRGPGLITGTVALPVAVMTAAGLGHAADVRAWVRLTYHPPRGQQQAYYYWRVDSLAALDAPVPPPPAGGANQNCILVEGRIHATGEHSFGRKHDERLWVHWRLAPDGTALQEGQVNAEFHLEGERYHRVREAWRAVLDSYIGSSSPAGMTPADYTHETTARAWAELNEGQTFFFVTDPAVTPKLVVLTPGMISRVGHALTPSDLLDHRLLPPTSAAEMSAVQRVFGTVTEASERTQQDDPKPESFERQGLLQFGDLECANVVLPAPDKVWTLAPQGAPKAAYGRFTTVSGTGHPLRGLQKKDLFGADHRLAGRRVALHHTTAPQAPPTGGWPFPAARNGGRPYLAEPEHNHTQLTQIDGWVPPGAEFQQRLRFINLNRLELGALLWLLTEPSHHHIGRMRGYGFGTVTVAVDGAQVQTGEQKRQSLLAISGPPEVCTQADLNTIRDDFDAWLKRQAPKVRAAVLAAGEPYRNVRYPTLDEYTEAERGARPALPRLKLRRGRTSARHQHQRP